jgi:hypothetical protein
MIKLEINKQYDSNGFWLRSKLITVQAHFWTIYRHQKSRNIGWCYSVMFGRGAGHKWGRTMFLAWRAKGGHYQVNPETYEAINPPIVRFGFTQNANKIPYHFGH